MKPSPGPSAAPDTPSSVRCLLDLPPECLALVLASLAVRDVLAAAATCPALKVAADDPILWRNLLWQVWIATAARGAEKADFAARLLRYQQASSMRAGVGPDSTGAAVEAELPERPSEARPLPLSQWLRSYDAPDAALAGVWRQRLMWSGSTDQCHGDTVGCACVHGSPTPQPFGSGRVVYYEVRVLSQGEHGFIAVGWSPEGFPSKNKQPGWVRHTYGYHGDDGHVYSSFGYGRRFGAPFGTGRTVGTGLVLPPPGAPPDRCHGSLLFKAWRRGGRVFTPAAVNRRHLLHGRRRALRRPLPLRAGAHAPPAGGGRALCRRAGRAPLWRRRGERHRGVAAAPAVALRLRPRRVLRARGRGGARPSGGGGGAGEGSRGGAKLPPAAAGGEEETHTSHHAYPPQSSESSRPGPRQAEEEGGGE